MLMKMGLRKCLQQCYINGELCSSSSSSLRVEIKFVSTLWSFQAKTFLWLLSPGIKLSSSKDNNIHVAKEKNCCCRSATESYPTLCNPMDCSMPGFSVHCQLPELAQTHVHRVGEAIQPSHNFVYLFGCTGSLLLCTGFLQLYTERVTLGCSAWASHHGGFSLAVDHRL